MELWQLILLFMGILIFVVIIYGMARSKKPLKAAIGGICRGLLAFGAVNPFWFAVRRRHPVKNGLNSA